jgi:hypothetical protein
MLAMLRDNIESDNTNKAYVGDLTSVLNWVNDNESSWLTHHGALSLLDSFTQHEFEIAREYCSCCICLVKQLLRTINTYPIICWNLITPQRYMEYIFSLQNRKHPNLYLS